MSDKYIFYSYPRWIERDQHYARWVEYPIDGGLLTDLDGTDALAITALLLDVTKPNGNVYYEVQADATIYEFEATEVGHSWHVQLERRDYRSKREYSTVVDSPDMGIVELVNLLYDEEASDGT